MKLSDPRSLQARANTAVLMIKMQWPGDEEVVLGVVQRFSSGVGFETGMGLVVGAVWNLMLRVFQSINGLSESQLYPSTADTDLSSGVM